MSSMELGVVSVVTLVSSFLYWLVASLVTVSLVLTCVGAFQYHKNKRANRELLARQRTAQGLQPATTAAANANQATTPTAANGQHNQQPIILQQQMNERHLHTHERTTDRERERRRQSLLEPKQQQHGEDDEEDSALPQPEDDDSFDWARAQRRRGGSHGERGGGAGTHISPSAPPHGHSRGRSIYDAVKKASKRGTTGMGMASGGITPSSQTKRQNSDTLCAPMDSSQPCSPAMSPRPLPRARARSGDEVPLLTSREASTASTLSHDSGTSPHTPGLEVEYEPNSAALDSDDSQSESGVSNGSSDRLERKQRLIMNGGASGHASDSHSTFSWVVHGGDSSRDLVSAAAASSSADPTPHSVATPSVVPSSHAHFSSAALTLLTMFPELSLADFTSAVSVAEAEARTPALPNSSALVYSQMLALVTQSHAQRLLRFVADTLNSMIQGEVKHVRLSQVQAEVLGSLIDKYKKEEEQEASGDIEPVRAHLPSDEPVAPLAQQLLSLVAEASSRSSPPPPATLDIGLVNTPKKGDSVSSIVTVPVAAPTPRAAAPTTTVDLPSAASVPMALPAATTLDSVDRVVVDATATAPFPSSVPLVLPPLPPSTLSSQQLISINLSFLADSHALRAQMTQQVCMAMGSASATVSPSGSSFNASISPSESASADESIISPALVYSEMYALLQTMHQSLADRLQARMNARLHAGSNGTASAESTSAPSQRGLQTLSIPPAESLSRRNSAATTTSSSPVVGAGARLTVQANGVTTPQSAPASASGVYTLPTTPVRTAVNGVAAPASSPPSQRPSLLRPASFPARSLEAALPSPKLRVSDPASPASRVPTGGGGTHHAALRTPPLQPHQHAHGMLNGHGLLFTPSPGSLAAAHYAAAADAQAASHLRATPLQPPYLPRSPFVSISNLSNGSTTTSTPSGPLVSGKDLLPLQPVSSAATTNHVNGPSLSPGSNLRFSPSSFASLHYELSTGGGSSALAVDLRPPSVPVPSSASAGATTGQHLRTTSYSASTFPPRRGGAGSLDVDPASIMSMLKGLGRELDHEAGVLARERSG